VDRYLGRLLAPHFSRSYLSALIEEGALTVDGHTVKPSWRLAAGSVVAGDVGEPASRLPGPEAMELSVLYEDEAVIVVDKPSGLVIHPGSGCKTGTLVNGLLQRYPELSTVGRADRPGIVHRLDRETTGVMVVARTNDAARSLVNQFKAKSVKKTYTAVVWGEMSFDSDWVDLPLGADPRRPARRAVVTEGGQAASTFYEVEQRLGRATLVAVSPRTGRTHQIRVHMAHLGFPIIGDSVYGRREGQGYDQWVAHRRGKGLRVPILQRQALHARKLSFMHPSTEQLVTYEASAPADIVDLLEVLQDHE
jgi:23S rRNA pseudouridine1911/1915/1917 synthase